MAGASIRGTITDGEDHRGNTRRRLSPRQVRRGGAWLPFRQLVAEALKDKLATEAKADEKPWLKLLGKLKHLHKETVCIKALIEEASERIDAEMWVGL